MIRFFLLLFILPLLSSAAGDPPQCSNEVGTITIPLWAFIILLAALGIDVLTAIVVGCLWLVALIKKKKSKNKKKKEEPKGQVRVRVEKSSQKEDSDLSSTTTDPESINSSKKRRRRRTSARSPPLKLIREKSVDSWATRREEKKAPKEPKENEKTVTSPSSKDKMEPEERSIENKLLVAVTPSEMQYYCEKITSFVKGYGSDLSNHTAKEVKKGDLFKKIPITAPEEPEAFSEWFNFISHRVMRTFTPPSKKTRADPDRLVDLLVSSLDDIGCHADNSNDLEMAMSNWIGRAMGIPETFLGQNGGGFFLDSAAEAIFCSMLAARKAKGDKETEKYVYYASYDAHPAIEKCCELAKVQFRLIQAEEKSSWGVTGEQLDNEIRRDMQHNLIPAYVLVTLGTSSTGSCDDLSTIAPVAKKYGLYIHVDAGMSGAFWIEPKYRISGLSEVNSINCSMDETQLLSSKATVVFCKEKKLLMETQLTSGENSHSKALKNWILFQLYGVKGLRQRVNKICDLGEYFMRLVSKHPNCMVWGGSHFGLFLFQYVESGMSWAQINEATTGLGQLVMNCSHKVFISIVTFASLPMIRVAFARERDSREAVDEAWKEMQDLIKTFGQARHFEKKGAGLPKEERSPIRRMTSLEDIHAGDVKTDKTQK